MDLTSGRRRSVVSRMAKRNPVRDRLSKELRTNYSSLLCGRSQIGVPSLT